MRTEEEVRATNKKTLKIVGGVILGFILLVIVISSLGGADVKKTTNSNPAISNNAQKADLAARVDKTLKKNLGTESYIEAGAPFQYINGMKDQGSGWVDVNYQTDCDKEQATFVAKQVMGTVGADITDLETVNVICTNGTSSYATRDGMFTD